MKRREFLASGACCVLAGCRRKTSFVGYAFVANQEAKTVAVVDLTVFSVMRQIRLEDGPTALASHPTRNVVYAFTPMTGTIYEIDTTKMQVVRKLKVAGSALTMRMSPDEPYLWVLGNDRRLARVDLNTFRLTGHLAVPAEATDFDLSVYTKLCAVASRSTGSVLLINLATGKVEQSVRISGEIGDLRFRSDGKMLIVADLSGRALAMLQTPGGRMMTRLPLAVRPDNLCFSTDNGQLFVTGEGRDVVVVVYPYNVPEIAETALAGHAPAGMGASGQFLFIANPSTGDVSIMDIRTRKVIAVAAVGSEPGSIAITPDDQYALVLNQRSGDMAVIRVGAIKNDRTKSAALFTMIPVGSKPVAVVVRGI